MIKHANCGHSYLARKNGRKENQFLENGIVKNCSVCWRYNNTPTELVKDAYTLVAKYLNQIEIDDPYDLDSVLLEKSYYGWLYT